MSEHYEYILELKNITKEFPGVKGAGWCKPEAKTWKRACTVRREWRREIYADENH